MKIVLIPILVLGLILVLTTGTFSQTYFEDNFDDAAH